MSYVEVVSKSGILLGMIDDNKGTIEQTEEWKKIQDEARKKKASKPPAKGGKGGKGDKGGKGLPPWLASY